MMIASQNLQKQRTKFARGFHGAEPVHIAFAYAAKTLRDFPL